MHKTADWDAFLKEVSISFQHVKLYRPHSLFVESFLLFFCLCHQNMADFLLISGNTKDYKLKFNQDAKKEKTQKTVECETSELVQADVHTTLQRILKHPWK